MSIFPKVQFNSELKERVLDDVLSPKYGEPEPRGFISRLLYKYRRWKGNAWKQEMCYLEGRFETFWTGVWNHLLKPRSI